MEIKISLLTLSIANGSSTGPSSADGTRIGVSHETLFSPCLLCRLEVDLILGSWANINVPTLSAEELEQFEEILKLETVDVYNMITGKQEVPEVSRGGFGCYNKFRPLRAASCHTWVALNTLHALQALQAGVMQSILAYSKAAPIGYASPEGYRQVKKGMSN